MFIYDLMPFVRFLPGRFRRIFQLGLQARDKILERCYFNHKSIEKGSKGFVQALCGHVVETNADEFINEDNIKGLIIDLIVASVASTATLLTNIFALLMVHPHVAKRIQNEIRNAVGTGRLPRYSDKDKMPYTRATVHELLRYTSGAGPLGFPHYAKNDVLFEGYHIEKGALVLPNLWYVHHDPKLWDDPWIFKPERFLNAEGEFLPPEHNVHRNFLAFSAGRRSCIGEAVAKSMLFQYLAIVLQSYDITLASEGVFPDVNPRNYMPGGELRVKDYLCRALPRW